MNYYDYLHQSRTQSHDRRYHPHGVTERTRCKYRGFGASESRCGESGDEGKCCEYLSFETADAARKWLYENTGIEPFHVTDPKQIFTEFNFSSDMALGFRVMGKPVSVEVYDADCMVFAGMCKDLTDRFGDVVFPRAAFLPYDFLSGPRRIIGSAPPDLREGRDWYITLGDFRKVSESAFGHSKAELPFDVARHELGHSLATWNVFNEYKSLAEDLDAEMRGKWNDYLASDVRENAATHPDESIADLFSMRLSPLYNSGNLPRKVEDFIVGILRQNLVQTEINAMDSKIRTPRAKTNLPYVYRVCLDFPPPPPEDGISWFDKGLWEYVFFDTYMEKLGYALGLLQIPVELKNQLIAASPSREWSSMDIGMIEAMYYGGYDYAEIVDYFKPAKQEQA